MTAASKHPARMMGLRPIRSDSQPKKMNAGRRERERDGGQDVGGRTVDAQDPLQKKQRVELPRVPDDGLAHHRPEQRDQDDLANCSSARTPPRAAPSTWCPRASCSRTPGSRRASCGSRGRRSSSSSEARNGMRQPHALNASSPMPVRVPMTTSSAANKPERRGGLNPARVRARVCPPARARPRRWPRRRTLRRARVPAAGAAPRARSAQTTPPVRSSAASRPGRSRRP